MELKITKTQNPKTKPTGALGFGKYFSDHIFTMEYSGGEWKNAQIKPYEPFMLDPSCSVLHYAQGVFEGAKAFKNAKGEVLTFRLKDNVDRMLDSADRVCIPAFDKAFVLDAIEQIILIDQDWIPSGEGTALYLRPTIIATEPALGVRAADRYLLYCILSPVGAYYSGGLKPVRLYVEQKYVRAAVGGTGGHKVIGNYAASLKAGENAKKLGYDQVMWLDAFKHRYVEEVGAMNIFFICGGKALTPALSGSILPGITRRSIIQLLRDMGIEVEETAVDIVKMAAAAKSGELTEVFGTGTAAVISPVGGFCYKGKDYVVGGGAMGKVSEALYAQLTGIQNGRIEDKYGWVKKLGAI
ncbi:MAG: branched-chain amino acid aminotransferase [Firmicutes bacterium]|nr:branched-chain amino acid aminotransferase [Bacillota bacterium]